jgi:hypothetical protein
MLISNHEYIFKNKIAPVSILLWWLIVELLDISFLDVELEEWRFIYFAGKSVMSI